MKLRFDLIIEVDPVEWAEEYGLDPADTPQDVRDYLFSSIHQLNPAVLEVTDITPLLPDPVKEIHLYSEVCLFTDPTKRGVTSMEPAKSGPNKGKWVVLWFDSGSSACFPEDLVAL